MCFFFPTAATVRMGGDDGGTFGVVAGVQMFWVYEGKMDGGGDTGLRQHE